MKFIEKLMREHPEDVLAKSITCPEEYRYEDNRDFCEGHDCYECWNREMPEGEEAAGASPRTTADVEDKPAKPRLCEILGVEVDEEFTIKDWCGLFRIHDGERQYKHGVNWLRCADEGTLAALINDPSLIIRKPRFTDEEMTVLRWLHRHGATTVHHNDAEDYCIYDEGTLDGGALPLGAFPSIRPGESVDLEEMFGTVKTPLPVADKGVEAFRSRTVGDSTTYVEAGTVTRQGGGEGK